MKKPLILAILLLSIVVLVACKSDDGFLSFEFSEGTTLEISVSHFSTTDPGEAGCDFVVYNLNKAEASGPLTGDFIEGSRSAHVGWANWTVPSARCAGNFNSEIELGNPPHKYSLEGEVNGPIDFGEGTGSKVASGTWIRDDGEQGSFVAYEGTLADAGP